MAAGKQDQAAGWRTLGRTSPGGKERNGFIFWFFKLRFSSVGEFGTGLLMCT